MRRAVRVVTGVLAWVAGANMGAFAAQETGIEEHAFASRSGPRGATMFHELDPQSTGVVTENRYDDPEMWGKYYQELTFGTMGTGVAAGDFDNDGRPDLFVVNKTGQSRLFRNLGGWKFEDVTELSGLTVSSGGLVEKVKGWLGLGDSDGGSGGRWKQGATFADVDNDGWLDLYVCRFRAPNLLYLNQRDGTFKEEAAARGLAVDDASGMAAFCDYDRDGWLDVYIQTNMRDAAASPDGQPDYLFRNNGDGTFADATARAGIAGATSGHSATWWDYDADGWPDLYVANDFTTPDTLYRNNRDGTFTNVIDRVAPHTSYYSMGSDLGDVNNDGLIDFFVGDMAATTRSKDQRGMAGSRARAQNPPVDARAAPQYMRNSLFVNTGVGRLLEAAHLAGIAATDWTWSVRFEDLDNDGRLDLHVTNGMNREYHNADILDRIMVAGDPGASRRIIRESPVLAEPNLAFRNLGDLRFENVSDAWSLGRIGVSFGAAFADFDGDGDLDLVHANFEHGATLLRNDSDSGHSVVIALRGTRSNRFGVGATVRIETESGIQVRQLVLARGSLSSSEPVVHFGLGGETRLHRLTVTWPGGHVQSFSDLPVDRKFTVTEPPAAIEMAANAARAAATQFVDVTGSTNLGVRILEGTANETVPQPLLPMRFDRAGPALAVGDVDGDGRDDVVFGGSAAAPTHILVAGASRSFVAMNAPALARRATIDDGPLLLFDADGDGANDLLVTKGGAGFSAGAGEYQPALFLNDGAGVLRPAPPGAVPPLAMSAGAAATTDFNRDGSPDLFLGARIFPGRYPLSPRSALLINRDGKFEDVTDTIAPGLREAGMVTSALWSDVDNDGWPDLLVSVDWGRVRYFRNNSGSGFEDRSETAGFAAAGSGWWTSLAAADFNGDGLLDYAAGNLGLNTQYRADAEHPALLYYGDFRGGGSSLLIEAFHEGDRQFPWRTRNDLGARIPALLRRFPTNDLYADATLPDLFGDERLAAARRLTATEFRSGVFLSRSDGTFRFEPLPRLAQIAPVQGMVAGDFDGDGHADIYAVHNSHAPADLIGRFDGGLGLLLKGDGRGGFIAVPPTESGLVVPGDAKALVVLDLDDDGWPDFLVSRNDDTALAYRNTGDPDGHSFRVVLKGPRGNPGGLGARITVEHADGAVQTSEVSAGGGWQSQSGGAAFFGYLAENPPRRVQVRWPDGAVQTRVFHGAPPQTVTIASGSG